MKLGEIARVARGVVTGNRKLFVITREEAKNRGIERFCSPVLGGTMMTIPKDGKAVVRDSPDRHVIIIATQRDVEEFAPLREYLAGVKPRVATPRTAPIASTYTGVIRFVANPDGLVITNSLYTVKPRQPMTPKEIVALVERLNAASARIPKSRYSMRYTPRSLEQIEI